MTHRNAIGSTEAIYLSLLHGPSYQKFLEDWDVLSRALTQCGLNKVQALRENLFLFGHHFSLRPIEKLIQLEEPIFADVHLRRKDDHIRILPFSDAVVRDLAPMIGDLVQDDNTVLSAVFLHDQPKVSRFGYQLTIHHWPRQQPHDLLNVVLKGALFHGPISSQS